MNIKIFFLAVVQGLTEFLPVSSSGHLVIFNRMLSVNGDLFIYTILHLGTIFSLFVFFFKDIIRIFRDIKTIKKIIIVTIITGITGIVFKDYFEKTFSNYKYVKIELFINGIILIIANKRISEKGKAIPTYVDSFIMGIAQSISMIPGISRSGITVSSLLFRRVNKEEAFKFSFIAGIPAIFGAFLLEMKDYRNSFNDLFTAESILAMIIAFIVGCLSLWILKSMIKKARLDVFGYYCIIASVLLFIFS